MLPSMYGRLAPENGLGLIVQTLTELSLQVQQQAACGSSRNDSVILCP